MDRICSSLTFPTKYKQLCQLENSLCEKVIKHLRVLRSDKFDEWVKETFKYLDSQMQSKDSVRFQRISISISCLYLFYLHNFSNLEPYILYLYSADNLLSMKFCSHIIAKIAGGLPPNEDGFSQKQLDHAFKFIKNYQSSDTIKILFGLYLLHDLAISIPLLFLFHSNDVPDQLWPWLINSSSEIRKAANHVLQQYLIVLIKYQGFKLRENFDQIFQKSLCHLLSTPSDCPQGALQVVETVIKIKSDFFTSRVASVYEAVNRFLFSNKHETKTIAFRVTAYLSVLDPKLFEQDYFNDYFKLFVESADKLLPNAFESLVLLIKSVPRQFNRSSLFDNMHSICLLLLQRGNIKQLFNILESLSEKCSVLLNSPQFHLWELVQDSIFTEYFLHFFPIILSIWKNHSVEICEKLSEILDTNLQTKPQLQSQQKNENQDLTFDSIALKVRNQLINENLLINPQNKQDQILQQMLIALKLIPLLPPIFPAYKNRLLDLLHKLLFAKSDQIRALVPKAMLHLTQMIDLSQAQFFSFLQTPNSSSSTNNNIPLSFLSSSNSNNSPHSNDSLKSSNSLSGTFQQTPQILSSIFTMNILDLEQIPGFASLSTQNKKNIEEKIRKRQSLVHQALHRVLEIAISDESDDVKVACLEAFSEGHYPDLANSLFLSFFKSLSKDTSPLVRATTFKLLRHIRPYSPVGIDIILREALLNCFTLLQLQNSLVSQVQVAQVLPALISASPSLFEVYATTFVPIILHLLKLRFSQQMANPRDPGLRAEFAIYLVQALQQVVKTNMEILEPFYESTIQSMVAILKEWGEKQLKHEVLSTLYAFISGNSSQKSYLCLDKSVDIFPYILDLIENSTSRSLRVQAMKFLGLCGAVAPKKLRKVQNAKSEPETLPDLFLLGNTISYNDYFIEYVVKQLRLIFQDSSLSNLKFNALSTYVSALNIRSISLSKYFPEIIPLILEEIENNSTEIDQCNKLLSLISRAISVADQRIIPFVPSIIQTIQKVWKSSLLPGILESIASLVKTLGPNFVPLGNDLITSLLSVLSDPRLSQTIYEAKCIPLLATIGTASANFRELIIPTICDISTTETSSYEFRLNSLDALRYLTQHHSLGANAVSVLKVAQHFCCHINKELRAKGFQLLYSLMVTLGSHFNLYTPRIVERLSENNGLTPEFNKINEKIMRGIDLSLSLFDFIDQSDLLPRPKQEEPPSFEFDISILELFQLPNMATPKHWKNWFEKIILIFIRESPNPSIRACEDLAMHYKPLGTHLFFPAFLSCWLCMSEDIQSAISLKISLVLFKPELPTSVLQTFTGLCEYMDRAERPLVISLNQLTPIYMQAQCLALALHNEQERWSQSELAPDLVDSIVQLYVALGRSSSAKALVYNDRPFLLDHNLSSTNNMNFNGIGIGMHSFGNVSHIENIGGIANDNGDLLLRLGNWEEAWFFYRKQMRFFPKSDEGFTGYIKACSKLRKYDEICQLANDFSSHDPKTQSETSLCFAEAFFFKNDFEKMLRFAECSPPDDVEGHINRAIAHILLGRKDVAKTIIESAFHLIAAQSSSLFWHRYERVYPTVLSCHILHELSSYLNLTEPSEEKLNYTPLSLRNSSPELISQISTHQTPPTPSGLDPRLMYQRMRLTEGSSDVWWQLVKVRMVTVSPTDKVTLNNYLELLLHERKLDIFEATLELRPYQILHQNQDPLFEYAKIKWLWAKNYKKESIQAIQQLIEIHQSEPNLVSRFLISYMDWSLAIASQTEKSQQKQQLTFLLSKFSSHLSRLQPTPPILQRWAAVNAKLYSLDPDNSENKKYAVDAMKGYFNCIRSNSNFSRSFEIILQILSLFFNTSDDPYVRQAICPVLQFLPSSCFNEVIPQLIAQLSHKSNETLEFIQKILLGIADQSYHSVLFPLLVVVRSPEERRKGIAQRILEKITQKHPSAMQQACTIQTCLLSAAITVFEECQSLIDLYFNSTDSSFSASTPFSTKSVSTPSSTGPIYPEERQMELLSKICSLLDSRQTSLERTFQELNFQSINLIKSNYLNLEVEKAYIDPGQKRSILGLIENGLRNVFYNVTNFLSKLNELSVTAVCPDLRKLHNTEIPVFGLETSTISSTNPSNEPFSSQGSNTNTSSGFKSEITIREFDEKFLVLSSQKRPRKMTLYGSDGNTYRYLLKGKEDLRLDQRVMQFFHLINTLIERDFSLSNDNIKVRTYGIIPLSPEVGLIQWVEGGDTFNDLVKEYRESRGVKQLAEWTVMARMAYWDIDRLLPVQRLELLREAAAETNDTDIRNMFWLKSPSADAWLERTTKFVRSVGLTSMLGYVLGLGDRHPSNFMIDKNTGDVIHIDFGDCFEVTRDRLLFPEKIPFRLTRMMISAFGVSGLDGEFSPVSERVMTLVRENCNILVSVLQIFAQEPIRDAEKTLSAGKIIDRTWEKINGDDKECRRYSEEQKKINEPYMNQIGNFHGIGISKDVLDLNRNDEKETVKKMALQIPEQVSALIRAAMDPYNLSMLYKGWCPLW